MGTKDNDVRLRRRKPCWLRVEMSDPLAPSQWTAELHPSGHEAAARPTLFPDPAGFARLPDTITEVDWLVVQAPASLHCARVDELEQHAEARGLVYTLRAIEDRDCALFATSSSVVTGSSSKSDAVATSSCGRWAMST